MLLQNDLSANLITDKNDTGLAPIHYAAKTSHPQVYVPTVDV